MVLLAVGLGWLATRVGFMAGMGAFIFGVAGLSLLAAGFAYSGKAPCPYCRAELTDLRREADGAYCGACNDYALVKDGGIYRMPEAHVAAMPTYALKVEPGTQPRLSACVRCGSEAASTMKHQLRKTLVGVPGVGRVVKTWPIQVPVCTNHAAPTQTGMPQGVFSGEGTMTVSSYRVWRDARA